MQKTKHLKVLLFIFLCFAPLIHAQRITGNEKIDHNSSGQLGAFQDFDEYVDLSTGKMHPSIDLLTLEGIKLKAGVSITYNSGANRVNDIPGELGMGWTLNAGGHITREVRGVPDDSKVFNAIPTESDIEECSDFRINGTVQREQCYYNKGYFHMPVQGKGHRRGYLDNHVKNCVTAVCDLNLLFGDNDEDYTYAELIDDFVCKPILNNTYPRSNSILADDWCRINGKLCITGNWEIYFTSMFNWGLYSANTQFLHDTEPDVFYYNLGNGITGKFVFDATSKPVSIPENGIKITPALGKHGGDSWIFTTLDGTQYYFQNSEGYTEESWEYLDNSPWEDNDGVPIPSFIDESKTINRYISKWYISKIVYQTGEEILFTYTDQPDMEYTLPNPIQLDYHPENRWGTVSEWGTSKVYNRTNQFIRKGRKSISQITSQLGTVSFVYDTSPASISGVHHLKSVVSNTISGKEIRKFNLKYESFSSGNCATTQSSFRFYLKEVQETTNGYAKPPHQFEYDHAHKLPCLGASAQDYWGYYNNNTTPYLIPPTQSLVGFVPHNLTGANRNPNLSRSKAGILKAIHSPLGGISVFDYEMNDFFDGSANVAIGGGLRIASITNHTTVPGSLGTKTTFTYRQADNLSKSSATKMDLGKNHDMYYLYSNFGNIDQPNGPEWKIYTGRFPASRYHKYLGEPVRYSTVIVEETTLSGEKENGKTVFHLTDFNTNPDIAPAKYVADRFDRDKGFELSTTSFSTSNPAAPLISKDFERGIVRKIQAYNTNGTLVQEESFNYSFKTLGDPIYGYRIANPYEMFWLETYYSSPLGSIEIYHHTPGIFSLDSKTTLINADATTAGVNLSDTYTYHDTHPTLLKSKRMVLSNGDITQTHYNYAFNFPDDLVLRNMNNRHIVANPIEVVTTVDSKVVSAQVNKYDCFKCTYNSANGGTLSGGVFAMAETLNLENATPISDYAYASNAFVLDPRIITTTIYENYDAKGNLLQLSKSNGVTKSYLWGYLGKYPVAEITNASYDQAKVSLGSNTSLNNGLSLTQANSLRNGLPQAMVTTHSYEALIGIISTTDPRGNTIYYDYDTHNRLKEVRDQNNHLISDYRYHFLGENQD
ncbi:MAG: hypothetical protein AAGF77_12305 [Bacteroidota bacterium]